MARMITRVSLCLLLSFSVLAGSGGASAKIADDMEEKPWQLVWEDDFAGDFLDNKTWSPAEQGLNWNNEDQAYIRDNVTVAGGLLILTAKKENWQGKAGRVDCPDRRVTQQYTSGEANTKLSWHYGKFEARIRVPKTPGILSAFWMTPLDKDWPPEIDIIEILGHDPTVAYFTNHYGTPSSHRMQNGNFKDGQDFSEDFHVFAVEWEPKVIRWSIDGINRFQSRNGVPDEPFILRFSLPVGPDWEGNPTPRSTFPQRMEIDWVRVYQRSR